MPGGEGVGFYYENPRGGGVLPGGGGGEGRRGPEGVCGEFEGGG